MTKIGLFGMVGLTLCTAVVLAQTGGSRAGLFLVSRYEQGERECRADHRAERVRSKRISREPKAGRCTKSSLQRKCSTQTWTKFGSLIRVVIHTLLPTGTV